MLVLTRETLYSLKRIKKMHILIHQHKNILDYEIMTQQLGAKANHSQITFDQLLYLIFVSSVVNHVVGISFKIRYLSF